MFPGMILNINAMFIYFHP